MFAETAIAINQAETAANPEWVEFALAAVRLATALKPEFTVVDVQSIMAAAKQDITTPEGRAMGPVMLRAKAAGWIEPTGRFENDTVRPHCHGVPRRVWKSLLYR